MQDTTKNFETFLKSLNILPKNREAITQFYIQSIREEELITKDPGSLEAYLDQIVEMFKNHPDLDSKTYKDYIKMVFTKMVKVRREAIKK